MERAEYNEVERPLLVQLQAMGWEHLQGAPPGEISRDPEASGRRSFRETYLEERLRDALSRANRTPEGKPWLDEERLDQAVATLTRRPEPDLVEANEAVSGLLLEGTTVAGVPGWDGGRDRRVHYIDWDDWSNNEFLAVSQFRVDRPGGSGRLYVICDVVLFVNGIPLVVAECKRRHEDAGIVRAVDQLLGYTGRLDGHAADGVPRLFHSVQLLVATQYDRVRLGTVTSDPEHFAEWKDVAPLPIGQVLAELGRDGGGLSGQETLAAAVLRPAHLLDMTRHFTVFMPAGERRIKVVARYQQYRAVKKLTARLRTGEPSAEVSDQDPRGGIVWHTQGSGKSLTMTFLVRAMRSDPVLRRFKVVVVTDRTDLQDQLEAVARLTGETVQVARTGAAVRTLIAEEGPGLIFAMIQKYRKDDQPQGPEETAAAEPAATQAFADDRDSRTVDFPVLNTSAEILVLIDEAHRSHTSTLHARLLKAMPNAARVGFTGTPIVSLGKKATTEIFGEYVDLYRLIDAEADGAVVPILYELHEPQREVGERERLDGRFEALFKDETAEQRQTVQRQHAGPRQVRESAQLIAATADDILQHYVATVLPNGFKAQVTAVSRRAAVRYRYALLAVRAELVAELDALDRSLVYTPVTEIADERTRFLVQVWPYRELLRMMDFVPVISEGELRADEQQVDPPEWKTWTDTQRQKEHVRRFKRPFPSLSADPWSLEDDEIGQRGKFGGGDAAGGGSMAIGSGAGGDPWSTPGSSPGRSPGSSARGRAAASGVAVGGAGDAPIAFLIVQSMLLTGFDAPIEQVLYSDRPIRQEELLQAAARPNRPAHNKEAGYFVDYAGIASDLERALSAYDQVDVRDALTDLRTEIPKLRDRHDRLTVFLTKHGVHDLHTEIGREACVQLLADEHLRGTFDALLRQFLHTLEVVLPRPEGLVYGDAAKRFLLVQFLVRRRYRDRDDGRFDPNLYGAKVRRLLDEHVRVTRIVQRIPPVTITHQDFLARVEALTDMHARAAEMEHALRLHISQHLNEDPVRYRRLSERLDQVLATLGDQTDQLVTELVALIETARAPREDDGLGVDPRLERPLLDILVEARTSAGGGTPVAPASLAPFTRQLADEIARQASMVGFADNLPAQDRLRNWMFNRLVDEDICELDQAVAVADELMQVVRARVHQYAQWNPDVI
jgi:type I restriction enzyme R subunit